MVMADLHYMQLTELTRRMHAGEFSPVDATQAMLDRISALDGDLHSYALVMSESALAEARQAEAEIARGDIRGPLHGAPVAVKDLCWSKGIATSAGMPVHRDYVPNEDATVVSRLRDAGAIILGKQQMTEGAFIGHQAGIEPPVNPWNAAYSPGGSSSGSGVATAAGLSYGSLGSDTGGSIRFPSALLGLTGLKPTWGRVSRYGIVPLAPTLDHVGPMTRSAADAAAMLAAIAGADVNDPTALLDPVPDYMAQLRGGIAGLRIGFDADWSASSTDGDTQRVLEDAIATFRRLGAEIVSIRFPDVTEIIGDWSDLCRVEAAVAHEATYPSRRAEYGAPLAHWIDAGREISGMTYQKIVLRRNDFRGRVAAAFDAIDLLLAPGLGFASVPLAQAADAVARSTMMASLLDYICPFNMTGSPTMIVPGGFTADDLPIAFQLVGPHLSEGLLCRAAHAFQDVTDFHDRHPILGS
jgi:amidase